MIVQEQEAAHEEKELLATVVKPTEAERRPPSGRKEKGGEPSWVSETPQFAGRGKVEVLGFLLYRQRVVRRTVADSDARAGFESRRPDQFRQRPLRRDARHDASRDSSSTGAPAPEDSPSTRAPRSSLILLLLATLSFVVYLSNNAVIRTLLRDLPELFRRLRLG